MASQKEENAPEPRQDKGIVVRSISTEMRESYLDYAMSVITARALPDVRDGLKPVHRRILFSMHEMGLTASAKTRKCAAIVGEVLGKYHPHGESAVYESLVKMAQDFSMRYPLAIGQGNFGSIDGDNAAAPRYTEAKMSRMAAELLADLDKETVDWRPNYENNRKEPTVLPSGVPNLLLNGTLGIAVGMATNIPPHNLKEVIDATIHLIDNKDATVRDLMGFIQGPDFPTGGIAYNVKEIEHAYTTGKGGVVVRGNADIVEDKKGNFQIIITSLPYRVNKSELIVNIADLVREKKLEGIRDLRDESSKDIRIVVELKNTAQPQNVLNYIYKHTQLEEAFHYNMVALVDGVPRTLSLKGMLEEFVGHRQVVVRKRSEFDLKKAKEREHILLGLKKALDHIDEIIKVIKASKDVDGARLDLQKKFKFSEIQANAILEMRLQKLAGLERKKIEDELKGVQAQIAYLEDLLKSPKKISSVIKDELLEISKKFEDERRTKIIKSGVKSISAEDLIPDEESMLVLTQGGYIKRTNPSEYKRQKRGGVGVVDLDTKEEDFVTKFLTSSAHSDLLFFTDRGKAYQLKMYDVQEGRRATKGKSIMNYLALSPEERVTSVLALPKSLKKEEMALMMVTKSGTAKKVDAASFYEVRRSGLIAISLNKGDELITAGLVEKGDHVMIVTKKGQSIRFKESDIRVMGRGAAGVRAMKLSSGDSIVGASIIKKGAPEASVMVVSELGYGKKTKLKEYKIQKRGGSGIKTAKVTSKTGSLIASQIVDGEEEMEEELVVISKKSQVIRTDLKEIPTLGRQTQGVRIMKLRPGDAIASLVCL